MLCQLTTVKAALNITDTVDDDLLTALIQQCGGMFDQYCQRKFERLEADTQEFRANEREIALRRFPVEVVTGFEIKDDENRSWVPVLISDATFILRGNQVVSLARELGLERQAARVTYTGGYVVPGDTAEDWQFTLPAELERACVDTVVDFYRKRNLRGMNSAQSGKDSISLSAAVPYLPHVRETLEYYKRFEL